MVKKIILLITLLVLIIPTSFAEIRIDYFGGETRVKGFIAEDDKLIVEVTIESRNQIDPKQVRLEYSNDYEFFDKCEETTPGNYKCTYEKKVAIPGEYTVSVYDSTDIEATKVFSKKITIRQDLLAPKVVNMKVLPNPTNSNNVDINYKIEDYSSATDNTNYCTGIKQISLNIDSGEETRTVLGNGLCEQEGTITYSFQTTKLEKTITLCLSAQDKYNQVGQAKCEELIFDMKGPEIKSLIFKDEAGKEITHVSDNKPFEADALIEIIDNNLDEGSITADFSKLDPSKSPRIYDDKIDNFFLWSLTVENPQNCEVTVKASDDLGNKEEKTLKCSFPLDNTPPELVELKSETMKNGKAIIGKESKIIAVFKDDDSKVSTAFLDASQLGMGSKEESEECIDNVCTFIVKPSVNEGRYILAINPNTSDNAGNKLSNNDIYLEVTYDSSPPIIDKIEGVIISGQEKMNKLVKGNTLSLIITGTDMAKVKADFSSIGGEIIDGSCKEKEGGGQECKVSSTVVNSGYYKFEIPITVYDSAGNYVEKTYSGEVFGLTTGNQDFWEVKTSCSPNKLNRQVTARTNMKFFCHVSLTKNNIAQNVEVINTKLDFLSDCKVEKGDIIDVTLANSASEDPYLEVTLDKTEGGKALKASCNLKIYSKIDNKIVQNPQIVEVPITLEFYNQAYDDMYKKYQQEKERAIDNAKNYGKRFGLDAMKQAVDWASDICSVKVAITDISTTLYSLAAIIGGVEDFLKFLPGASVAAYNLRTSLCNANEELQQEYLGSDPLKLNALYSHLNKFCMISNCQLGLGLTDSGEESWAKPLSRWIGGQTPWCKKLNDYFLRYKPFANILKEIKAQNLPEEQRAVQVWDVQDSIMTSAGCFCLPGIIKNLEKQRQIRCRYATCLVKDVPNLGINIDECKKEREYEECAFYVNEVWSVIPFTNLIDYITQGIGQVISDPINLVSTFAGILCKGACNAPSGTAYTVCSASKTLALLGEALQTYNQIKEVGFKGYQGSNKDYCKELDDATSPI